MSESTTYMELVHEAIIKGKRKEIKLLVQKAIDESKQVSLRRIVDTGEKEPFDIYRGAMKDEE